MENIEKSGCTKCKKTKYHGVLNKQEIVGLLLGCYLLGTSIYGSMQLVRDIINYFK
jgi:hypothetical protein